VRAVQVLLTNPGQPDAMRKLALILILALSPALASAATLRVALDQAVRLSLKAPAADVIVGNPAIADVTVTDGHHLVVIGKTPGVTNLIVTTASGRAIFNEQILVSTAPMGHVTVISGTEDQEWACGGGCEKTGASAAIDMISSLSNATAALRAPAPANAPVTPSPTVP
jgi:hypothetical protein